MPGHSLDRSLLYELLREKRFPEALRILEEALAAAPDDPALLTWQADVLLKSGDTYRAEPIIARLLTLWPEHPRTLLLAAERHRLEGHLQESTSLYLASLAAKEDPYVRSRAVDGLISLHKHADAARLIDEGLKRVPGDPWLLRKRARLELSTDRPEDARRDLEEAARHAGTHSPRDRAEALKIQLGKLPLADQRQELGRMLTLSSHRANPFLQLLAAELALEAGDAPAAQKHLDQLRALDIADPWALKQAGFLYNKLEQWDQVLNTLGQAFIQLPRDVVSQQVLLAAAKKAHQLPRLKTLFTLAYERHPGFHKLAGLIKKVDRLLAEAVQATDPTDPAEGA